jgi:hypothetical protein
MNRRTLAGMVATFALVIGAFGLLSKASINDDHGHSITCGNTFATGRDHLAEAFNRGASQSNLTTGLSIAYRYVQDCRDAISTRRTWAWPLTGVGVIGLIGALTVRNGKMPRTTSSPTEPRRNTTRRDNPIG